MKSSVLAMLFAFVAVTTARQMQNTNPNAIVKCTDAVRFIIDKATIDPQAQKCSTDSGVKLRALMTPTGLKAEDAKKIANTESCNQWFTGVGSVRKRSYPGQVTLLGHTTKLNISPSQGIVNAPNFVIL
ncbi:hypothetical protein LEN26_017231 [Aphanomyces euteiches]|nr:hypothetical protein LEN26_017231 [Aphanomyces euteiches]KAH9128542.1 hypothetical protein AeMF1_001329 [Aphanomyces euteiches]